MMERIIICIDAEVLALADTVSNAETYSDLFARLVRAAAAPKPKMPTAVAPKPREPKPKRKRIVKACSAREPKPKRKRIVKACSATHGDSPCRSPQCFRLPAAEVSILTSEQVAALDAGRSAYHQATKKLAAQKRRAEAQRVLDERRGQS